MYYKRNKKRKLQSVDFFCVICLFFQEQIYTKCTYMILYTQCLSTQKLQCKNKLVFITYCFVITFEIQSDHFKLYIYF